MGEEQRLSPEEQLASAREAFEQGTDFTVAVEEEFALLDPESLTLVNRFEELQAAAQGTELEAPTRDHGLLLGATGTHPGARWQDQRISETPHYRRNNELLQYVVWR